jgi:hypothetical protein
MYEEVLVELHSEVWSTSHSHRLILTANLERSFGGGLVSL